MRRVGVAISIYTALSLLIFGRDVIANPTDRVVGDDLADKTLYMWSFRWWPSAVAHGHNPLDVNVAWAPHGFDFGLGTAGGGLALLSAPLTALVGPIATYNVLILAAPALAATTAFLLAHLVTSRFVPSLVAGYIYGFSSYELGHMISHLPLAFIALVPLVPYLVLRRHNRELSMRTFATLLTATLVIQFLIVTQIFFNLVLLGAIAATLATLVLGVHVVRRTILESAGALLLALVLVSPILAYAFVSDAEAPARAPFFESADVLNYVVPTRRTWLQPPGSDAIARHFTGTGAEQGAYLSLPFVALVAFALFGRRRSRHRLLLALVLAAAVVLSLGTRVKVAGLVVGIAPWALLAHLPVIGSALPARMTLYTALLAGLLIALALTDRSNVVRWLLVAAGIAATLPNLQLTQWSSDVPRPRFFADGQYKHYIQEGSTALVLPYGPAGWSMLWHAESEFSFHMIGGHFALRVTPKEEEWRDVYETLGTGLVEPRRLCSFLRAHGVDVVVVAPGTRPLARRVARIVAGDEPDVALDSLVYRLDQSVPMTCGSSP